MLKRFQAHPLSFAGSLAVAALLSGCAGGSGGAAGGTTGTTGTTGTLATGGAANVYALNDASATSTSNSVLEYSATGGSSTPAVTLSLSTLVPSGAAVDGAGLLYISGVDENTGVPSVNVYAAGAGAGAVPLRTILTNTSYEPISVAVNAAGQADVLEGAYDVYGNLLATQIEVFAAGAGAGAAATATIAGSATGMIDPQDIAVDTAGNIYVANYEDNGTSQILTYAAGANGGAAPSQVITFSNEITGVAVDSSANIYAAELSSTGAASIVEYAAGSTGTPTAIKTISGAASGLSAADPGSVRVDAVGNIWVIEQSPDTSTSPSTYFEAWAPSANGNVAPAVSFTLPSLANPNGAFAIH